MQGSTAALILATRPERAVYDALWRPLAGRMTLARTLDVFEDSPVIHAMALVVNAERLADAHALCQIERWRKVAAIVAGGRSRQASTRLGLDALADVVPGCAWVIIHDGIRPLITAEVLEAGLEAAKKHLAAIAAVPVKETIKQAQQGEVVATLDRAGLWTAQTPHIFSYAIIQEAYEQPVAAEERENDAVLLGRLVQRASIFAGSYTNIAITTPQDMSLAEALLQGSKP